MQNLLEELDKSYLNYIEKNIPKTYSIAENLDLNFQRSAV